MTSKLKSLRRLAVLYTALANGKSTPKQLSSFTYHSKPQRIPLPNMAQIRLVPALEDNYMYLLIDESTKECAAVDPVEPQKILAAVKEEGVTLSKVLTTHHHWDHAGGNEKLVQFDTCRSMPVYGGDDRIGALNNKVKHGDEFKLGSLNIKCLATPCHTSGHICYYVTGENLDQPVVFTGDTLFVGACGKFFEGTPQQMYNALVEILSSLPSNTRVFCGHEYTVGSLKYALHVEPENEKLKAKFEWAKSQRSQSLPTIPSTIGEEKEYNPFMRVKEPSVQKHAGQQDPVKVMGFLREEKNSFKPK